MNAPAPMPHKLNAAIELIRTLNVSNLQQLQTLLSKEINDRGAEERREAIAKIIAIAQASGIDLNTLASKGVKLAKKPNSSGPVPAQFANPADSAQTWSGRGRTPLWLKSQLDAGADIETFRIVA